MKFDLAVLFSSPAIKITMYGGQLELEQMERFKRQAFRQPRTVAF
jgi:hypothetical protein